MHRLIWLLIFVLIACGETPAPRQSLNEGLLKDATAIPLTAAERSTLRQLRDEIPIIQQALGSLTKAGAALRETVAWKASTREPINLLSSRAKVYQTAVVPNDGTVLAARVRQVGVDCGDLAAALDVPVDQLTRALLKTTKPGQDACMKAANQAQLSIDATLTQ